MIPGQLVLKEEDIICNAGRTASINNCDEHRGSSSSDRIAFSFL